MTNGPLPGGILEDKDSISDDYIIDGINQANDYANSNHQDLKEKEFEPTWQDNTHVDQKKPQGNLGKARKRGPIASLLAVLGVSGGLIALVTGPANLIPFMSQSLVFNNDSSTHAFERRFMRTFTRLASGEVNVDATLCAKKSTLRCKRGMLSTSALKQMKRKGVTALGSDGKPINLKGKFPSQKPAVYSFDMGDGKKPKNVAAKDIKGFLANKANRKYASKLIGSRSAFNLRVKTRVTKSFSKRFVNKYNLSRNAGLMDGKNKRFNNARQKTAAFRERLKAKIPPFASMDTKRLTTRLTDTMKKGKTSPAYTIALGSCIAAKLPTVISAGVAGFELMRILPVISELVLEPGGKMMVSGIHTDSAPTPEDVDAVASILTERVPNKDGKPSSALDSKYLQTVLGVNHNLLVPSEKFTPGWAILNNPAMAAGRVIDGATEPTCNFIMSPIGMVTWLAVESAILKTNPVGLGLSLVGGFLVFKAAESIIETAVNWAFEKAVNAFASHDYLPDAEGEELGDALGIAAMAYFSAEGMSNNLQVLSKDDYVAFQAAKKDNEQLQRELDIASLSPFDTSSPYTFLGSIVHKVQTASITGGSQRLMSLSALTLPFRAMSVSSTLLADGSSRCIDSSMIDSTNTCRNAALLPEMGYTESQIKMSDQRAEELVADWMKDDYLDMEVTEDTEFIDFVKEDTPLHAFLEDGGAYNDASTGQYLTGLGDYISPDDIRDGEFGISGVDQDRLCEVTEDNPSGNCGDSLSGSKSNKNNSQAYVAMPVIAGQDHILDAIQGLNEGISPGEDDNVLADTLPDSSAVTKEGWSYPMDSPATACGFECYPNHIGMDVTNAVEGDPIYAIRDGDVIEAGDDTLTTQEWCNANIGARYWRGIGQSVVVKHVVEGKTYYSRINHMQKGSITVRPGDKVRGGQQIGRVGMTGCTTGIHAHVDISVGIPNSNRIDPTIIFGRSW